MDNANPSRNQQPEEFTTTHWSLVVRAGKRGSPEAEQALTVLCRRYWYPLYAYVRRRGVDLHEAQDFTQEFFARLLEKNALGKASPARGRFRSFLLAAMKHFLANEWDRAHAQKRGGGHKTLSLDLDSGEARLRLEPAHGQTAERTYEREWALQLLALVLERLHGEFAVADKSRHFELLRGFLTGDQYRFSYTAVAAELSQSEAAVRQAVHRLRKRYRELLREEIAQTVADAGEVDEEMRRLFGALSP